MEWYEDRMHKAEELDELYKLYQENELFESMKRLGIVKKGGNNATVPMDDDSTGATGKHDQRSRNR